MIIRNYKDLIFVLFITFGNLLVSTETLAQVVPPPDLVTPENGTTNLSLPVTLVWEHPSANVYRLQVATDASFENPVIDVSGITNTYYQINSLSDNTMYYWRVNATALLLTSDWSVIWNFTTAPLQTIPPPPDLVSPLNSAIGQSVNPVLDWVDVTNADYYRLMVAEDESFNNKVFDDSTIAVSSQQVGPLDSGTTYYWRVNSRNSAGAGDWSEVWNFTTSSPQIILSPPVLVSPLNGSIDESFYPVLTWNSVQNADYYKLQVALDESFANTIFNDSAITTTYKQIGPLDSATQYFWRVNARNSDGESDWSSVWHFITVDSENLIPQLVSPNDGERNLPLTVLCVWNEVQNAQQYYFQVSLSPDFSSLISTNTTSNNYVEVENLINNTTYFWRVRAKINNNWGQFAASWRFTTRVSTPKYINIDTTISYPLHEDISKYKSSDYRIIGIPGVSYIPITNFLPGVQGEDWQSYWDNGAPSDYLIGYNNSDFVYSIGKAFWIIKKGSMQITATIEDAPLNNNSNAEIPLHNGWNLITNPFTYPIPWDSIKANNDITEPIYSFEDSYNISQVLSPFKGFYFFNSTNLTLLQIPSDPSIDTTNSTYKQLPKLTDDNGWVVNIKLSSDEYTDSIAWLGVSSLVSGNHNKYDIHKPRDWGSVPAIYFPRPEWDQDYPIFASDIRPLFNESSEWTFEIKSVPGNSVSLSFNLKEVPGYFDVFLFNSVANKWINIKDDPSYQFTPVREKTSLKVMIGKDIADKLPVLEQEDFYLGNNFPNPFNLSTSIPVTIPEKSVVEIAIFNLLGNKVKTIYNGALESGEHLFKWNGTDDKGNVISSGVYFYRLSDNQKVNSMKKMMLVK